LKSRAVWLIFDELDQRLAFQQRPASVSMPEFDRLRGESFYGGHTQRAGRNTLLATASLLTGRTVARIDIQPPGRHELTFAGGTQTAPFSSTSTIFSRARKAGANAAIAGWYQPYCRLFADNLTECVWASAESQLLADDPGVAVPFVRRMTEILVLQARKIPGTILLGLAPKDPFPPDIGATRRDRIREYEMLREAAFRQACDQSLDLVYIHWPIPHAPGIYERKSHSLTAGESDYLDNLELADRSMGELRAAMLHCGTWDSSAVLVSSDHSLRSEAMDAEPFDKPDMAGIEPVESDLVPFLLKLPHQNSPARYDDPFNAVVSSDLILAILKGGITSPGQVSNWIGSHTVPAAAPGLETE
jgi:hypothetical protein